MTQLFSTNYLFHLFTIYFHLSVDDNQKSNVPIFFQQQKKYKKSYFCCVPLFIWQVQCRCFLAKMKVSVGRVFRSLAVAQHYIRLVRLGWTVMVRAVHTHTYITYCRPERFIQQRRVSTGQPCPTVIVFSFLFYIFFR